MFLLCSCDYFNELKYRYYFHNNGEVLCKITKDSPHNFEDGKIRIKNLNTDHPDVIIKEKTVGLTKLIEKESFIHAQFIDKINGNTHIMILDTKNALLQYLEIGIDNGSIFNVNYFANCK